MGEINSFSDLTVEQLQSDLGSLGYISDRGLTTSLLLSMKLGRPILLEGEAGDVGALGDEAADEAVVVFIGSSFEGAERVRENRC